MIDQADRKNRGLTGVEGANHFHPLDEHSGVFQNRIAGFYDRASFSVFMAQKTPVDSGRGMTSIVAGHTEIDLATAVPLPNFFSGQPLPVSFRQNRVADRFRGYRK